MDTRDISPNPRETAVDNAKTLLGHLNLGNSTNALESERREQFEAARPEEFLADLLAFYSFQGQYSNNQTSTTDVVLAFHKGVGEVFPAQSRQRGQERGATASAKTVTELLVKIIVGAPTYLQDPECTRNFIAELRDRCSPEDFQKNILPLVRAINKALAARQGVEGVGWDSGILRNINGYRNDPSQRGLQLDTYDISAPETPGRYASELLERYKNEPLNDRLGQNFLEKKDIIIPRLEAILEKIKTLRVSTPEITNVQIFLPKLDKDDRVLAYDVETEVELIEDQLAYFEQYIAARNRKRESIADEKKRAEEFARASEISHKLSIAEMGIANLIPTIQKLQGSETTKGSVASVRAEAEGNDVCVHIAKNKVRGCFDEIDHLKRAIFGFSRDKKYIDAVCTVIDQAITSLQDLQKADTTTLTRNRKFLESRGLYQAPEWKKNFTPTDTQLPSDEVKGEERLDLLEPMNARLTEQKETLNAAYTEANDLKNDLAPQCARIITQLTELKRKIAQFVDMKSDDGVQKRVLAELETFRKTM